MTTKLRSGSDQLGFDLDFGMQRPMNGAFVGNFQELLGLVWIQVPHQLQAPFYVIYSALPGFTVPAVRGMNFCVPEGNCYALQRPFFCSGVQRNRH